MEGEGSEEEEDYSEPDYAIKVFQLIRCASLSNNYVFNFDASKVGSLMYSTNDYGGTVGWRVIINNSQSFKGSKQDIEEKEDQYKTYYLDYGQVKIEFDDHTTKTGTDTRDKLENLQDYLFPDSEALQASFEKVKASINAKDLSDEDLEDLRAIANCEAKDFSAEEKYEIIKSIIVNHGTWETNEDLILDIIENFEGDFETYAQDILDRLVNDDDLLKELFEGIQNKNFFFGREDNADRFIQIIYSLWEVSTYSNVASYQYIDDVLGGASNPESPYSLIYQGKSIFPLVSYEIDQFKDGKIQIKTNCILAPQGNQEGLIAYDYLQPVFLFKENDGRNVNYLSSNIPALMFASFVKHDNWDRFVNQTTLGADIILTFTGIGNLTKLRHLSKLEKAGKIVLASIEFGSSALDLLLNYTELCTDDALCNNLRQYNFYLQMMLLSGEAASSIYKTRLQEYKVSSAKSYEESREALVAKYGDESDEVKALDEHFGVANVGGSFRKLTTKSSLSDDILQELEETVSSASPIKFDYNSGIQQTAKDFLNETGNNLYDLISGDFYIKLDASNGRMLMATADGNTHYAFVRSIQSADAGLVGKINDIIQSHLSDQLDKLKGYIGLRQSRSLRLLGQNVSMSNSKTNTIVGRLEDVGNNGQGINILKDDIGDFKNIDLGENVGGINVLNRPSDAYWNGFADWMDNHNMPWMKRAVDRGDDIYVTNEVWDIDVIASILEEGGYRPAITAYELRFLQKSGFKPKNLTAEQWDQTKAVLDGLDFNGYSFNGLEF